MKRIISLLLVITLVFLVSCSCNNHEEATNKQIYTSIYPVYSLTKLIVKNQMDVHMVVDVGQESHDFNPATMTVMKVIKSDLFLYLDDSMETWASKITSKMSDEKHYAKVSKGITFKQMDGSSIEGNLDPHVWTSAINCQIMVENIYQAIIKIDPEHQSFYEHNKDDVINQLSVIDSNYHKLFNDNATFKLYFLCPLQFKYLLEDYKLAYVGLYATCSEEIEPSSSDILNFINIIKTSNPKYLIQSPYGNQNITNKFQNEFSDITICYLDAFEIISKDDFMNNISVIDMMERNYQVIKKIAKGE